MNKRRTYFVSVRRPKTAEVPEGHSAIEDVDFAKMFPGILNAECGEIELVGMGCKGGGKKKGGCGGGKRKAYEELSAVPAFGAYEYAIAGALCGVTLFCTFLTLIGVW